MHTPRVQKLTAEHGATAGLEPDIGTVRDVVERIIPVGECDDLAGVVLERCQVVFVGLRLLFQLPDRGVWRDLNGVALDVDLFDFAHFLLPPVLPTAYSVIRLSQILGKSRYSSTALFPYMAQIGGVTMDIPPDEQREWIAQIYKAVGHQARIAILYGLANQQPTSDITEAAGITRGALQDHFDLMVEADVVYRPTDRASTYALTPVGQWLFDDVNRSREQLVEVAHLVEEKREEIRGDIDPALVDDDELATQLWNAVRDDVAEILD